MTSERNSAFLEYSLCGSFLGKYDVSELDGFISTGLDLDGALVDEHELHRASLLEKSSE